MILIRKFKYLMIALVILMFLSSCTNKSTIPSVPNQTTGEETQENSNKQTEDEQSHIPEQIDYEMVKPNETGQVMVLMYHYFGESEKDVWWRSYDNFRRDLQTLYDQGYRLVSMEDFNNNNIDIPAGTTPVIFTFDDGSSTQFKLIEKNGELVVDPDTAVGIMLDFYHEHPDFGLEGTFYVNEVAFADSKGTEKERLKYLLDLGLDIGNHTFGHTDLSSANPDKIQKVIASHVKKMQTYFPEYRNNNTLALPYGHYSQSTYDYIIKGEYDGVLYENDVILAVGASPTSPPGHKDFKPSYMPRVRASEGEEYTMYYFLENFEKNPTLKYISDGDKDTICIPEENESLLEFNDIGDKKVIKY